MRALTKKNDPGVVYKFPVPPCFCGLCIFKHLVKMFQFFAHGIALWVHLSFPMRTKCASW